MFFRIIICLGVVVLTSCGTARMAIDPGLEVDSEKYKITERHKFLSGGDLVFAPYKATEIYRGFISGYGSFISFNKFKVGEREESQDYAYQFKGKNSWNGYCKVKKGHEEYGPVSAKFYADLDCTFIPIVSGNTRTSEWKFSMRGGMSDTTGNIKIGSKTIKVISISKMEGSPLTLGQHTGYYFYSGSTIIGGVDIINKEGPVWLSKKLSEDEKDTIAMVAVALLLNQVN